MYVYMEKQRKLSHNYPLPLIWSDGVATKSLAIASTVTHGANSFLVKTMKQEMCGSEILVIGRQWLLS